jgi:hypothetical protein
MNVAWFSCGVSSAIMCYLCRKELDEIHYQHIDDQHPDSLRFLRDTEALIGKPIHIHQSPYKSVDCVCRSFGFLKGAYGARCTDVLKRRERKDWERKNQGRHTYYWGLDCTEQKRCDGIVRAMPDFDHRFPLIERGLTKEDAHEIANRLGLKRPAMYDLGYNNNNCIGCIKGGIGYWNKIRKDFPDVFASRAKLERDLGRYILKDSNGNPLWLDELDPERGADVKEIQNLDCSIMCEITIKESEVTNGK